MDSFRNRGQGLVSIQYCYAIVDVEQHFPSQSSGLSSLHDPDFVVYSVTPEAGVQTLWWFVWWEENASLRSLPKDPDVSGWRTFFQRESHSKLNSLFSKFQPRLLLEGGTIASRLCGRMCQLQIYLTRGISQIVNSQFNSNEVSINASLRKIISKLFWGCRCTIGDVLAC